MTKHGKHYQDATKLVERTRKYDPQEAIVSMKRWSFTSTWVSTPAMPTSR